MLSYTHSTDELKAFLETETSASGSVDDLMMAYFKSKLATADGSIQDVEHQVLSDQLDVDQGTMSNSDLWSLYLQTNSLTDIAAWITAGGFISNFLTNPTFGTSGSANRNDWDALSFGDNDTGITVGAASYFTSDQNVCNVKFASATGSRGIQQTLALEAGDYTLRLKYHIKPAGAGSGLFYRVDGSTSGNFFNLNVANTNSTTVLDQDFTCVSEDITVRVYSRNNSAHDVEWGEPEIIVQ